MAARVVQFGGEMEHDGAIMTITGT